MSLSDDKFQQCSSLHETRTCQAVSVYVSRLSRPTRSTGLNALRVWRMETSRNKIQATVSREQSSLARSEPTLTRVLQASDGDGDGDVPEPASRCRSSIRLPKRAICVTAGNTRRAERVKIKTEKKKRTRKGGREKLTAVTVVVCTTDTSMTASHHPSSLTLCSLGQTGMASVAESVSAQPSTAQPSHPTRGAGCSSALCLVY